MKEGWWKGKNGGRRWSGVIDGGLGFLGGFDLWKDWVCGIMGLCGVVNFVYVRRKRLDGRSSLWLVSTLLDDTLNGN